MELKVQQWILPHNKEQLLHTKKKIFLIIQEYKQILKDLSVIYKENTLNLI